MSPTFWSANREGVLLGEVRADGVLDQPDGCGTCCERTSQKKLLLGVNVRCGQQYRDEYKLGSQERAKRSSARILDRLGEPVVQVGDGGKVDRHERISCWSLRDFLASYVVAKSENLAVRPTRYSAPMPTRVYFIGQRHEGPVKIGISTSDLRARLGQIQSANPERMWVLGFISNATGMTEHELHERFAADRIRGEWFKRTPELQAVIDASEKLH